MDLNDVRALLKSAVPIDDIDELHTGPNSGFPIIWIDTSERPDLRVLSDQTPMEEGYSICSWFYEGPGKYEMSIGIRVEMRQPVKFVIPLVFKVKDYYNQLQTLARAGTFWIVPGPPPKHLTDTIAMTAQEFADKVVRYAGQGLFVQLEPHLVEELRGQLAEWKRVK